jgi:hypothetical protein
MKKIFIILLIFICGCETTKTSIQSKTDEPSKTIRNPKCEDIKSFKVFQVLDNFVLANVCRDSDDQYCFGHVVYFPKEKGKIYFDDQIIKVKDNECAIYIGTHQYQTKNGYKTVPIVKIIDSQITNPE